MKDWEEYTMENIKECIYDEFERNIADAIEECFDYIDEQGVSIDKKNELSNYVKNSIEREVKNNMERIKKWVYQQFLNAT